MPKEVENEQMTAMAQAFAAAMAANNQTLAESIQALAPKPVITESSPEYRARMEAEGFYDQFEKPVFQNAYEAQARGLSKEIRHRASNLKSGKYLQGRVEVVADNAGVHIMYPVKGDNMMINQTKWSDFPDLINKIWAEMQMVAA